MDAPQPTSTPKDVETNQDSGSTTHRPPSGEHAPKAKRAPTADRPPGKSLLPITRVQKIMKADKELPTCAKEAVFLISVATEEFIKRLGRASQQQAMREKRMTVQHRDVATAVRRSDEFVFLEEILAAGIPAGPAAPPPAKRKQKAGAPPNDNMNIKEAFVKGKEKATDENAQSGLDPRMGGENIEEMDVS